MEMGRSSLRKEKAGISTAVITLIILVIGVALAIIAMAIAGGFITGWGGAARVTIERADILIDPSSGNAYITVDVRNSGGASLTGCSVTMPAATDIKPDKVELRPGQAVSFTGTSGGLNAGQTYVVQVTCTVAGTTNTVSDQKAVLAHI